MFEKSEREEKEWVVASRPSKESTYHHHIRPSICVPGGPRGEARRRVNTQNEKEWEEEVKQAKKEKDEASSVNVCLCVKAWKKQNKRKQKGIGWIVLRVEQVLRPHLLRHQVPHLLQQYKLSINN